MNIGKTAKGKALALLASLPVLASSQNLKAEEDFSLKPAPEKIENGEWSGFKGILFENWNGYSFPSILEKRIDDELKRDPYLYILRDNKDIERQNNHFRSFATTSLADTLRRNEVYLTLTHNVEDFLKKTLGTKIGIDIVPKEVDSFTYGRTYPGKLEKEGKYDVKLKIAESPSIQFGNTFWKARAYFDEARLGIETSPLDKFTLTVGVIEKYNSLDQKFYAGVRGNVKELVWTVGFTKNNNKILATAMISFNF